MIEQLVIGLSVSVIVATIGFVCRALTGWGAISAVLVGTAVIWGVSWGGALLLGAFFASSSALSVFAGAQLLGEKSGRRDAMQVFANGGFAALAALYALWGNELVVFTVVAGSLAAATSDTWATEIGSLSNQRPRFIVSRTPTIVGESGGVTKLGLFAAVAGAVFIGLIASICAVLQYQTASFAAVLVVVSIAGLTGSVVDSLAGEFLQSKRWCPACQEVSESTSHHCGCSTVRWSGSVWIDNDMVNAFCTGSAAGFSLVAAWLIAG